MSGGPSLTGSLADAKAWLTARLDRGAKCPCCGQTARIYQRKMSSTSARATAALWRVHGTDYGHLPTVARDHLADVQHQGGYLVLGAHWGLIQAHPDRAGWWRVTPLGVDWLLGRAAVPARAAIFNGRRVGELRGRPVTVLDVLAERFDLDELLGAPREDNGGGQLPLLPTTAHAA
jgi:hypothetical protein